MKKYILFFLFASLTVFLISCEKENANDNENNENDETFEIIEPADPEQKGERLLGINISENTDGFESAFNVATEAGIQIQELNIPWTSIETSEGIYEEPYGGVLTATSYYGDNNIELGLSLAVINTVKWEVPDYLDVQHCDSSVFIDAFVEMAVWTISQIPQNVTLHSVSIGNEVDLVLETATEWNKYEIFYAAASDSLRNRYPDLKIGVKNTIMGGLFNNEASEIQSLNQYSDVIMLNYYPMDENFQVLEPNIAIDHFDSIVSYFPAKKIWLTELGYQSGSDYCNSNETKQAEFYHHFFTAWDNHKDKIEYVMVNWLHDQSPETINEWSDYYGDDPALLEYLSTLGLRNYDNSDKYAWKQFLEEANARGWSK